MRPGLVARPQATRGAGGAGEPQRHPRQGAGESRVSGPAGRAESSTYPVGCAPETEGTSAWNPGLPGPRSWRRERARAPRSRTIGEPLPPVPPCRGQARGRRRGHPRMPDAGRCAGQIWRGNRNPSCINDPAALAGDQAARVGLWITGDNRKPLWITIPRALWLWPPPPPKRPAHRPASLVECKNGPHG